MNFLSKSFFLLIFPLVSFAGPGDDIGKIGKAKDVQKVIRVEMYDNYFKPDTYKIKAGQTVKFVVKNKGQFVHEFNIGTETQHIKHQPEMAEMTMMGILYPEYIDKEKMKEMAKVNPSMKHSHGNSVLLEPGEKGELIWKFSDNQEILVAFNVPGHYEDGMVNEIIIR
jgi:uncharacterized cupredoxin-like copper-binding protein